MTFHITGKNFSVTEAITQYAEEKMQQATKATDDILDLRIVMEHTRNDHADAYHVTVTWQAGHDHQHCENTHADLYAAIDGAKDEVERMLRDRKSLQHAKQRKAQVAQREAKSY